MTASARRFERLREQGVDGLIVLNEATALARDAPVPSGLQLVVVDSPIDGDRFRRTASCSPTMSAAPAAPPRTCSHSATPRFTCWPVLPHRSRRTSASGAGGWLSRMPAPQSPRSSGGTGPRHPVIRRGRGWRPIASVTAVFAANDQMALGAIRALAEGGRRVPEDVSVVGFDDIADAADYRPPLTTVRQDFDVLGERAVAALIDGIEAGHQGVQTVPTTLVVRASTALAAS